MQGKQAKVVSPTQERAIVGYLDTTRYPSRDRVMFLFSMKAGLHAKEMASLTWAMLTDAAGQVAEVLHVPNRAVVYLQPADNSPRLTRRLSQGLKVLDEWALMTSQQPSAPW